MFISNLFSIIQDLPSLGITLPYVKCVKLLFRFKDIYLSLAFTFGCARVYIAVDSRLSYSDT